MATGREREAWDHTAAIMATIINSNPFSDAPAVDPLALNPYRQDEGRQVRPTRTIDSVDLAQMWCGQTAVDYFAELDRREAEEHGSQ